MQESVSDDDNYRVQVKKCGQGVGSWRKGMLSVGMSHRSPRFWLVLVGCPAQDETKAKIGDYKYHLACPSDRWACPFAP